MVSRPVRFSFPVSIQDRWHIYKDFCFSYIRLLRDKGYSADTYINISLRQVCRTNYSWVFNPYSYSWFGKLGNNLHHNIEFISWDCEKKKVSDSHFHRLISRTINCVQNATVIFVLSHYHPRSTQCFIWCIARIKNDIRLFPLCILRT